MTLRFARLGDLPEVQQLYQEARHAFRTCGLEDLPGLIQEGVAVVGETVLVPPRLWGFLGIQVEDRPSTLPSTTPTRAYLRAALLDLGHPPSRELPDLLRLALARLAREETPVQVMAIASAGWLRYPLERAGFRPVDALRFYVHTRRDVPPATGPATLRPARQEDLRPLALLDREAFAPLWHMGTEELAQLMVTGRVQVAEWQGELAGYTSLAFYQRENGGEREAQLVRLAVHPRFQGRGIGRQLLAESLRYAHSLEAFRVQLNTQESNRRSQQLYQAFGFRQVGGLVPVMIHMPGQPPPGIGPGSRRLSGPV